MMAYSRPTTWWSGPAQSSRPLTMSVGQTISVSHGEDDSEARFECRRAAEGGHRRGVAVRSTVVKVTLVAIVLFLVSSLTALAQPAARVPRVGSLAIGMSTGTSGSFQEQLAALGYAEGKTVILELRYAEGRADRLSALAAELVQLNVDVIVAWGVEPLEAVRRATNRIPIVMMARADPVATGLAASLAKPGGNLTGVTIGGPEIAGKRLDLLREVLPRLSRVAVLRDPSHELAYLQETESAARALNLRPLVFTIRAPAEFDGAFQAAVRARAEAVLINETAIVSAKCATLAELELKHGFT